MTRPKGSINVFIEEKKCRKCKKNFIPAPMHIYHEGSKYYCSWHCYNHRNDEEAVKHDQRTT